MMQDERIEQCRQGRPEGFDWLVEEYGGRLYGYFMRSTRSPGEAEDMVQELMVKVIANIGDYRHAGRFEAWLFTIAANLVRDRGRRAARRPASVSYEDGGEPASRDGDDPALRAQMSEWGDRLQEALGGLSEVDREVILLRYYGGLSFKELAERFGLPLGTALAKVHRGLRTLRGRLEENEK